jgi:hypothetical protein
MYMEKRQGGGILNGLTIKFAAGVYLLSLLAVGCVANAKDVSSRECVENILKAQVVRVDNRNHRFFVVGRQINVIDIKDNLSRLEKCFADTEWQPDWAISVFTDAKYAGYKDEDRIIPFHKDNAWANAYVLEYDRESGSLIQNPAVNPQQVMP